MTAWAKMSSNLDSNPKIRRAGRNGREVFLFILRKNAELDTAGGVPVSHVEAWYLADQLMMSEEDAASGLSACVRTGLIAIEDGRAVIKGWNDEWGKRPMTEAERKRIGRAVERARRATTDDRSAHNQASGHRPDMSGHIVTGPDCHGSDQIRSEEIRSEEREKNDRSAAGSAPPRSRGKPKPSDPTPAERDAAIFILRKLGERSGVAYSGSGEHVRTIVARLRDGITEGDLRKVIGYCAIGLGWQDDPKMAVYLRPKTLFGASKIHDYLDPARTWFEKEKLTLDERPRLEAVP